MNKRKITIRKQEKKKKSISDHYLIKKSSKNTPLAPKRKKKSFNVNKSSYSYLNKKKPYRSNVVQQADAEQSDGDNKKEQIEAELSSVVPKSIKILKNIQVGELAKKMNLRPNEVIGKLMKMGEMVNTTKVIDAETAAVVAADYGCKTQVVSLYEETLIKSNEINDVKDHKKRPLIVTVMGHVDHGKTLLLDVIRKTNVVAQEAGSITQHIGAYQAKHKNEIITFLDTPGHEAFTAMRARGAAVTDLVILVVAADDGIKQQTLEAITHAKEAKVPILVAINKIDLEGAKIDDVKKQLANAGLTVEEWGGETLICEVSAKEGTGISELLDAVLLHGDLLNCTANPLLKAQGRVIEAKIDAGKGPIATVLVQQGTLKEGDIFVSGAYSGRVRTMIDDKGKRIKSASPSTPVAITGMTGVPEAGDPFQVVDDEKYAREVAMKRQQYTQQLNQYQKVDASENLTDWIKSHKELNIIIKADVQGSVEALREGLNRLSTDDIKVRVISGSVGGIFESDVKLADASHALIVAFQTRPISKAADLATSCGVKILYSSIIYEVINNVKEAMEGLLEPEEKEETVGHAQVRKVFKISRSGTIAGLMITKGRAHRKDQIRLIRDNIVVFTGAIESLRRIKEDVESVKEGFECGLSIKDYADIREGDEIEYFLVKKISRKL